MEHHDFLQGSPEWHEHRATHFNASDAPAMLGISPYKTRNQLLQELYAGVFPEVDAATQRRFDDGHRFEALARPLAEEVIGKKLYPVTGSEGKLSASFDGLTMCETINFEHKTLNAQLRQVFESGEPLPELYTSQMEQQHMVSGAQRTLFMASVWDENDNLIEEHHRWYEPEHQMRERIMQGWAQLAEDLANYQHVEPAVEVVGRAPESLPALHIEVTGMVTASNLAEFKEQALAVFSAIPRDLQTDEDFANAAKTVKWCKGIEGRLKAAKQHALSQTASIDELFRAIDDIDAEARRTRLELDKLVAARTLSRTVEIQDGGKKAFAAHIEALNTRLGKPYMPHVPADFVAVTKGLRTVASKQNAVDTELARAKIAANEIADRIDLNLKTLREQADGFQMLFADTPQLVLKANDDLVAVIKSRIAEHKAEEEAKVAAIRAEEERKANEKLEADREKIRQEALAEQAPVVVEQPAAEVSRPALVGKHAGSATHVVATGVVGAPMTGHDVYADSGSITQLLAEFNQPTGRIDVFIPSGGLTLEQAERLRSMLGSAILTARAAA